MEVKKDLMWIEDLNLTLHVQVSFLFCVFTFQWYYPNALASAYLFTVQFLIKTFHSKIRVLQTSRRTSNLPITISDADSGKLRKIRVLETGSRTYDLLITSSNADSGKLRKSECSKLGADY